MIVPFVFVVLYPVGLLIALRYMSAATPRTSFSMIPTSAFPALRSSPSRGRPRTSPRCTCSPGSSSSSRPWWPLCWRRQLRREKKRHTLEGVLYTPVCDTELVVGKILGSVLPAVVVSWVCFGVYAILVNLLGNPLVGRLYFPTLNWSVLMLLVVPAVSVCVTACLVWVSARVSSYQSANSIAGFAMLPLVLLIVGQATG